MSGSNILKIRTFLNALRVNYPLFYEYLFSDKQTPVNTILRDFIRKNNIEGGETSVTTRYRTVINYDVVWKYIIENSDKHDWWML